jgi:hypothetical protein
MALYGNGKYPFVELINKFVGEPHIQAYLVYVRNKYFDESWFDKPKKCCVEQWLYNRGAYEIKWEFNGFIAGITFDELKCPDVDQVICQRKLFVELCKIHKEMSREWDVDEEWEDMTEMVTLKKDEKTR